GDDERQSVLDLRQRGKKALDSMQHQISEFDTKPAAPAEPVSFDSLAIGMPVFVSSLGQPGSISRILDHGRIEVQVGLLKAEVPASDLSLVKDTLKGRSQQRPKRNSSVSASALTRPIPLTLQTQTNAVDLRGASSDQALERA